MRYTKVNNQLIEKYTSLKVTSTLPASGEDKEIVLVKGHGVYQYRTNTWVKVLNLEADVSSGFIGEIRPTIEATLGAEWLECDGSSYNTSTYPDLYALLGTATLPDLRECVLYGCGTNGTNSLKQYTLFGVDGKCTMGHTHMYTGTSHSHNIPNWIKNHNHGNYTYGIYTDIGEEYSRQYDVTWYWAGAENSGMLSYVTAAAVPVIYTHFTTMLSSSSPMCSSTSSMSFGATQIGSCTVYPYTSSTPRPNEFGVKYKIRAKI